MGSDFSKQICCGTCGRCEKQEESNEETSETKPILQTSGDMPISVDVQPSTAALVAPARGSEEVQSLCWDQQLSAGAVEESVETCSPVDPMGMTEEWKAAWSPMDFLVASADRELKGEVAAIAQLENEQESEKACNTDEKITPVPPASEAQLVMHAAQDPKLAADIGQPDDQAGAGSEDDLCAGITLQESDILKLMEVAGENEPGQDCEIKPPTETGESLTGRNLPLHAVQKMAKEVESCPPAGHTEQTDRAGLHEEHPQPPESVQITSPVETVSVMNMQATEETKETVDPSEATANAVAEMHSTSVISQETLYPGEESPEPANQLLDFIQQETQFHVPAAQEAQSLSCAESAELSEVLCQPSAKDERVLSDLVEGEESRERDPGTPAGEAEPQQRIMQQTMQLPEEPLACIQMPAKEEAGFLSVAPLLYEVPESGGEMQAEDAEALEI